MDSLFYYGCVGSRFGLVRFEKSFLVSFVLAIVLMAVRLVNSPLVEERPLMVTDWDALGYYMYAPSIIVYQDATELSWMDSLDQKYNLTGGQLYQASRAKNGNYVNKYLGGVSLMQLPFFMVAHGYASATDHDADGFSQPYQYAAALSGVIYCILALFILRVVMRRYFTDNVTAITLLLVVLATNFIEYASIKSSMSHSYIFFLYAMVLYTTMQWHKTPKLKWAALTGFTIGLATICRPTEAIMLFIPLLWGMENKEASRAKWALVRKYRMHVAAIALFGIIGVLPQLIYWKMTAGTFVHNVGSKWSFLSPFFQVLFGFRKGWFIYTPITVFFIAGFFFIRKYNFHKSVIVFSLLNIWIVISWFDWNYGATYSSRALVQSYPVMALAMAGFLTWLGTKGRWRGTFAVLATYLTLVNIFQLWQYNKGIIHFEKMTRSLYGRVYLDPSPSPLDFSLLYTDEILSDPEDYQLEVLAEESGLALDLVRYQKHYFMGNDSAGTMLPPSKGAEVERWLQVKAGIQCTQGLGCSNFLCTVQEGDSTKMIQISLNQPLTLQGGAINGYEFFVEIPSEFQKPQVKVLLESCEGFKGKVESFELNYLVEQ